MENEFKPILSPCETDKGSSIEVTAFRGHTQAHPTYRDWESNSDDHYSCFQDDKDRYWDDFIPLIVVCAFFVNFLLFFNHPPILFLPYNCSF